MFEKSSTLRNDLYRKMLNIRIYKSL